MVASESVAVDALGFELERDLLPGEAVFIDKAGKIYSRTRAEKEAYTPCIFEFVYFARPGLHHRQALGVQGAAADGRKAGGENPASAPRPRHRCS